MSALGKDILNTVSLQEAFNRNYFKSHGNKGQEAFQAYPKLSTVPHLLNTPMPGSQRCSCWKWGNKKGMDWSPVPYNVQGTLTLGFRVLISSKASWFWHHRQEGNFSLGKQVLETLLANCCWHLSFSSCHSGFLGRCDNALDYVLF